MKKQSHCVNVFKVISPKPYSDVVDGTNPEAEERARVKRMQLNGGSNQQDTVRLNFIFNNN